MHSLVAGQGLEKATSSFLKFLKDPGIKLLCGKIFFYIDEKDNQKPVFTVFQQKVIFYQCLKADFHFVVRKQLPRFTLHHMQWDFHGFSYVICCMFRPAFGCCALQTLVKIVIFSIFTHFFLKKQEICCKFQEKQVVLTILLSTLCIL